MGDEGPSMCGCFGKGARSVPESRIKEQQKPAPTLPRVPDGESGREKDGTRACKDGKPSSADLDHSDLFAETTLMGNLAIRFSLREPQGDGEKMEVTNDNDANACVRRQYRSGWTR
jgi:hypothetical protein